MDDYFLSEYKPYGIAARVTGVSEIKLHQLRIQKVIRVKTSEHPDYIPLVNLDDVKRWIGKTNFNPRHTS